MERRTVKEEYALAREEKRQPLCVYCGEPLTVQHKQYSFFSWQWDKKENQYKIREDSDADKPYCANCKKLDWDFLDNDFIGYDEIKK